jgi:hypothetical protein
MELPNFHLSIREGELPKIHFSNVGVTLDEDLSFEEFRDGLRVVKRMHSRSTLMLADLKRAGEVKFGEIAVEQAMGQLEFDMPTVKAIININSVPASLREHDLEPEHYVALAKADITPKQREKWAATAASQNLSASTLKASIAEGEVVTPGQAKSKNHGIASPHGLNAEFAIWLRRVGGIKGVMQMDEGYAEDIARELADIIDFGIELRARIAQRSSRMAEQSV